MIASEVAGVMFSANPVTGIRNEIVVDASPGLGEAVVSGQVTPDHYVLRKRRLGWRITERHTGRQEIIIRARSDGGTEHVEGTGTGNVPILSDKTLYDLARLARSIEQHFGSPQDIEWALAKGKLSILQARPITALPEPVQPLRGSQRVLGNLMGELLPMRPYPFDITVWMPALFTLIEPIFKTIGLRPAPFEALFAGEDSISIQPPHELTMYPTPAIVLFPFRVMWLAFCHNPLHWRDDPLLKQAQSEVRSLETRNLSALSWRELIATLQEVLKIPPMIGELRRRYFPRAALATGLLLVMLKLLGYAKNFATLITGSDSETLATNRALEALAAQIRAEPNLVDIFANHEPDQVWKALEANQSGRDIRTKIQAFLDQYGHRETAVLLVSQPTWKDKPELVLGMLKAFITSDFHARSDHRAWEGTRDKVLEHPLLRLSPLRSLFLSILRQARILLPIREDTHFYGTLPMPVIHRTAIEMGQRLVKLGVISSPEEVFHLTLRDLKQLDGAWPPSAQCIDQLRTLAMQRKQKREALENVPYRIANMTSQGALRNALLTGMSGSPGVVEGTVRIIRNPSEFNKLRQGDVLVAPYTNPAWTPLFQRAAAVVVDTGGVASHAAIVAREYGIPAVMGTVDGTYHLADDQYVRVDGSRGCVFAATPKGKT
jgi:rifampicin phosphotransferase